MSEPPPSKKEAFFEPVAGFRGGWADGRDRRLPDSVRVRLEAAEQIEAERDARAEHTRDARRAEWHEAQLNEAIRLAQARGEPVSMLDALRDPRVVGHTRAEFVALCSARQDLEDAQAASAKAAAWRKFQREFEAEHGPVADTSAHVQLEHGAQRAVEAVEAARVAAHVEAHVEAQTKKWALIQQVRQLASKDRRRAAGEF